MSECPTNTNVEQVQSLKPDPKHILDQIQACAKHYFKVVTVWVSWKENVGVEAALGNMSLRQAYKHWMSILQTTHKQ